MADSRPLVGSSPRGTQPVRETEPSVQEAREELALLARGYYQVAGVSHPRHLAKTMRRSMRNVMAEKVWAIWGARQDLRDRLRNFLLHEARLPPWSAMQLTSQILTFYWGPYYQDFHVASEPSSSGANVSEGPTCVPWQEAGGLIQNDLMVSDRTSMQAPQATEGVEVTSPSESDLPTVADPAAHQSGGTRSVSQVPFDGSGQYRGSRLSGPMQAEAESQVAEPRIPEESEISASASASQVSFQPVYPFPYTLYPQANPSTPLLLPDASSSAGRGREATLEVQGQHFAPMAEAAAVPLTWSENQEMSESGVLWGSPPLQACRFLALPVITMPVATVQVPPLGGLSGSVSAGLSGSVSAGLSGGVSSDHGSISEIKYEQGR